MRSNWTSAVLGRGPTPSLWRSPGHKPGFSFGLPSSWLAMPQGCSAITRSRGWRSPLMWRRRRERQSRDRPAQGGTCNVRGLRVAVLPEGGRMARTSQAAEGFPPPRVHWRTSLSGQVGISCTHTGGTPVLREAHMTRFSKMWLGNGHCDRTVLGRRVAGAYQRQHVCGAQIDPDQMTRNAPRDLPSFDQTYQRHLGVLDVLPH